MATPKENTELTKASGTEVMDADMLAEIQENAGLGTSQNADDNIIPFIVLLQDMSPQVKKRDPDYVEGAEVGMLLNKATRQLYAADAAQAEATGLPLLTFQPAAFDRCIVEWVPRVDGGGFVARHDLKGTVEETMTAIGGKQVVDPQDDKKKIWKTADGKHDLIDTRYHYGNILSKDSISPAVISFSSTGHTASREWMTLMNNFKVNVGGNLVTAPSWFRAYTVKTKPKNNAKGDFFVITVDDAGVITDAAVRAVGKELHKAFSTGAVKAANDEAPGGASGGGDTSQI